MRHAAQLARSAVKLDVGRAPPRAAPRRLAVTEPILSAYTGPPASCCQPERTVCRWCGGFGWVETR